MTNSLLEHQSILFLEHDQPDLLQHYELYRANDITGTGAALIKIIQSGVTEFLIKETIGS